jgi:hypothetical protein
MIRNFMRSTKLSVRKVLENMSKNLLIRRRRLKLMKVPEPKCSSVYFKTLVNPIAT